MRSLFPVPITLALITLAACASSPPRQTTADLARAHTLVATAEQNNAQQYAPSDLQAARDKVQQADQLAGHDPDKADQLANEASADARLATARTQNGQAQHALSELHLSLRTLRNEEQRGTTSPPTPSPPNGVPQGQPSQTPPLNQQPPPDQNPPPRTDTRSGIEE